MTCINPIKNIFSNWFNIFSIKKKQTDDHMECMEFGICDYALRQVEEVHFFHY